MMSSKDMRDMSDLDAAAWEVARFAREMAAERDITGKFPTAEFQALHAARLLTAPLPSNVGGAGLGSEPGTMASLLRVLAIIGWGNLSLARLYEGHVNALLLIEQFGTADQREKAAAEAQAGQYFAVWNTEAADGVEVQPGGERTYCLRGAKTFASGAGAIGRPLVTGRLPDGGWQMILLDVTASELDRVDTSWWRPLGMHASASHRIDFTGLEVGSKALLGEVGDYYRQPWFSGGAIRFAAAQVGGAAALLDAAVSTLRDAGRTEDELQRARIGEAAIAVASGEQWLDWAAVRADQSALGGAADPTVSAEAMVTVANMTRTAIERICLDVLAIVERAIGARGLLKPHPIERISRDLTLYLRQPAPDAALRDVGVSALSSATPSLLRWQVEQLTS